MSELSTASPSPRELFRLIVIDDDIDWCRILRITVQSMGHSLDTANTLEEAMLKIQQAEDAQQPYDVALIDMNFEMGKQRIAIPRGKEVVQYVKQHHPYMACIILSGSGVTPDSVLDLRDDYDLDYYVQKDRFDLDTFSKALERAVTRVRSSVGANIAQPGARLAAEATAPPTVTATQPVSTPDERTVPPPNQVTLDFQMNNGETRIIWRSALIGREVSTFVSPFSEQELPLVIRALDVVQHPNYPTPYSETERLRFHFSGDEQVFLGGLGIWHDHRVAPDASQTVGRQLYAALAATAQGIIKAVRNASIAQRTTMQYILRFPKEGIRLAALPWELLWDGERNQALLIRGNTIDSCERYVDMDVALPPSLTTDEQPHLLALVPRYGIPERARQDERTARLRSWERLKAKGKMTYGEIGGSEPLTMANLNDYLLMLEPERPSVIHYFGHGVYRDGKGYLMFDDGSGGTDLVSAERLAAVLGDIRLVVLHACQSAMVDEEGGLLTGVAPALSIVTGAVVAMQLTVNIAAATRFSQVFYDQLLDRRRSLQSSVARARQVLFTEATDGTSWYVPTLYIRARVPQDVYLVQ